MECLGHEPDPGDPRDGWETVYCDGSCRTAPAVTAATARLAAAEARVLDARRALVLAALRAHRGNRTLAAAELGVSRREVQRVIVALRLVEQLDAIAVEEGWLVGASEATAALRGKTIARGNVAVGAVNGGAAR